jgi:hypothetical protein
MSHNQFRECVGKTLTVKMFSNSLLTSDILDYQTVKCMIKQLTIIFCLVLAKLDDLLFLKEFYSSFLGFSVSIYELEIKYLYVTYQLEFLFNHNPKE